MPKHMNRTKIEWTDFTWSPVTGCRKGCPFCYAARIAHRFNGTKAWPNGFEPTLHEDRFDIGNTPIGAKVFVCSMGELFGPWVPEEWTRRVLEKIQELPDVQFQFLTKFPENLARWNPWPENAWVGASVVEDAALSPTLEGLSAVEARVRFISFEPLHGPIDTSEAVFVIADTNSPDIQELTWFGALDLDWLILGSETGNRRDRPLLDDVHKWAGEIIKAADLAGVPVFLKDNLHWPVQRREWPAPAKITQER